MTQLWLLEDLEPFPDRPEPGDLFTPTTFWVDSRNAILDNQPLPAAVCSHVPAVIRPASDNGPVEWVAHLGDGFSTMLPGDHAAGQAILHGCLMWDRYLWLDYRTQPNGQVRLVHRAGHIIQRRTTHPPHNPDGSQRGADLLMLVGLISEDPYSKRVHCPKSLGRSNLPGHYT